MRVFLIAGEESGDQLGAGLMRALRERCGGNVAFAGVGGVAMAAEGLQTLFPISEIALFGIVSVLRRLPRLLRLQRDTVRAIVEAAPDVLVVVDSPDFNQRLARSVRTAAPGIPIVTYVSPSVWAWRPGRARAMRRYVDHVLALLPFEPVEHARLGGPPCTYVGHPLGQQIDELRPNPDEARRRASEPPVLLVLPGSRRGEIERLLPVFRAVLDSVLRERGPVELILPTVPHLADQVRTMTADWPWRPQILLERAEKRAAFRLAAAALAASGTVTLELALARVPMVAAYRVGSVEAALLRRLIRVPSVILANLTLRENVVPEFIQENCTPAKIAPALAALLSDSPERRRQLAAFDRLDRIMEIGTATPDATAAAIVLDVAGRS